MCPTTERDLADGIGPAGPLLALGSDSHAVIDPFEEARAVELDTRLATEIRGRFSAPDLLRAATNHACLGWPEAGRIEPGAPADLVTVGLDSVRLAGAAPDTLLESLVFAAAAADVHTVIVAGRPIVTDGHHTSLDVPTELIATIKGPVAAMLIDNISTLVTNDPELGTIRDAALVFEGGVVVYAGPRGTVPLGSGTRAVRCRGDGP